MEEHRQSNTSVWTRFVAAARITRRRVTVRRSNGRCLGCAVVWLRPSRPTWRPDERLGLGTLGFFSLHSFTSSPLFEHEKEKETENREMRDRGPGLLYGWTYFFNYICFVYNLHFKLDLDGALGKWTCSFCPIAINHSPTEKWRLQSEDAALYRLPRRYTHLARYERYRPVRPEISAVR